MKRCWFLLGIFAGGCLASNGLEYEAMSDANQYHLALVRKGMGQKQVLKIMHKPYSYESFQVDDDIYDVWFYVTRPTGLDQTRMVPQNLTPLTFKNGVLVGTGYNWYYYAMKEQAGEVSLQKPQVEKPKSQELEDSEFEKSLKSIEKSPQQPQQTPQQGQTQKKSPDNEKLPPNVHIISKKELTYVPDNDNSETPEMPQETCQPCQPCQSPCDPCPTTICESDQFSVLSNGMTESQVFKIFGEPVKYETFELSHDVYDAWFYDTAASKSGKPSILSQHQTVLTFKNAVLISLDDEKYDELKKSADSNQSHVPSLPCQPCQSPCGPCPTAICGPDRFSVLSNGMTESQVFKMFGEPMKYETFELSYDIYDAWFYDTIASKSGKASIIPQHQTILTFKNAVLISLDDEKYYELKKLAESNQSRISVAEPELSPRERSKRPSLFKQYQHKDSSSPLGVTSQKTFSEVKVGMTEEEVMKSLGVTADQETFTVDEDVYNVWFYKVGSKEKERIPLTFKNGILIGKTAKEYNQAKGSCTDCHDEEGERMQEDEAEQNFNYW